MTSSNSFTSAARADGITRHALVRTLLALCICALCISAMAGCSSSSQSSDGGAGVTVDSSTGFTHIDNQLVGTWVMQKSETYNPETPDDEPMDMYSEDDMATLRAAGQDIYLNLYDDAVSEFYELGALTSGDWLPNDATSGTITLYDGTTYQLQLEGDTLVQTTDSIRYYFKKGDPAIEGAFVVGSSAGSSRTDEGNTAGAEGEGEAEGGSEASSSDDSIEQAAAQVSYSTDAVDPNEADENGLSQMLQDGDHFDAQQIADDDMCTIYIDGSGVTNTGDPSYNLVIQNKTEQKITVWAEDKFTVGDKEVTPYIYAIVEPREIATTVIQFDNDELGSKKADALHDVKGTLIAETEDTELHESYEVDVK